MTDIFCARRAKTSAAMRMQAPLDDEGRVLLDTRTWDGSHVRVVAPLDDRNQYLRLTVSRGDTTPLTVQLHALELQRTILPALAAEATNKLQSGRVVF
ncbi:MAG: hypothetical protein AMXMBFR33_02040 [Candidatus Xenobia bacterium]